jgi:dihydroorotate dehydrogenase
MPDRGIGGVSGDLLKEKSKKVRKLILDQHLPIELIGVGGFSDFQDVKDFWKDGGKAIQIYTSYVYQGPDLLKKLNQEMVHFLQANQIKNLEVFFKLDLKDRQQILL